jgi:hypothetical protein
MCLRFQFAPIKGSVFVLLPENLRTCFEPSVQAWILYKAPQWNAHYPNIAGLIQRRWTPWSKPKHGFDNYHNKDNL